MTLSGGSSNITKASETRTFTAAASGGTDPITYSWAVTSDGTDKGALSAASGNPVTWTSPATLPTANQTWSITATATDAKGKTDSSGCSQTLTYTYTAPHYTHLTCYQNACVIEDCSPVTTKCNDDCTTSPDSCQKHYQHRACNNDNHACTLQDCNPFTSPCSDSCSGDTDCQKHYQHRTCNNDNHACTLQDCNPFNSPCSDSCSADTDCQNSTPQTHKACVNNACQTVSGTGADTCSSDVSCRPVAKALPIPQSGSTELTVGSLVFGAGAIIIGVLLAL